MNLGIQINLMLIQFSSISVNVAKFINYETTSNAEDSSSVVII